MIPDGEVLRLAQSLARNCGYAVLPCSERKMPTRAKREGGEGCKDASKDPERIAWLWRNWPGPLIGIATGRPSGIDVLDIDVKHDAARGWWWRNAAKLPNTRAYRTRSGGVHLYFQHRSGVRNRAGQGVDVRGDGGYAISWFGAKFEALDHNPPAPWPDWLVLELFPLPQPEPTRASGALSHIDARLVGLLRKIETTPEGQRNAVLFWAACRAREMVRAQALTGHDATRLLRDAARLAGLAPLESSRTIASGLAVTP